MNYDVVVAGAGPAGSVTARNIAQSGAKVLILEKRSAVGQSAFCSGLVSPRTLNEAKLSDGVVLNRIKGALVHSLAGRRLHLGGDKVQALVIDRAALDGKLAEQAQQDGAILLLGTSLVGIHRMDGGLRVTARGNGKTFQVTTPLLIGADGVGSVVALWMGSRPSNGVVKAIAAEARLDHGAPDKAQIFVGSSVAPGWFGWIIPVGDGRVRLGTGNGNHAAISVHQLLDRLVEAFPSQFEGVSFDRVWTKAIPVYSPVKTYGDHVLLVGDAACQVKPVSGGGIYTGLVAARHCARVALEAMEVGDFSEAFLSRYETAWKGELGAELERGIDLKRAFLGLEDEEIDELLALLGTPFLQEIIARIGDIDFPSGLMEQLVRVAPALRFFLHVPLRFPSRWAADLLSSLVEVWGA